MDLDPNIAAAEATRLLVNDFISAVRSAGGRLMSKHLLPYLASFDTYLSRTHLYCSVVRLITNRDRTFPFADVYVEGKYRHDGGTHADRDICQLLRDGGKIVVQGLGGIGKTMLLKHLWLNIFASPEGRIPVLIELRRLNGISTPHLVTYLRNTLAGEKEAIPEDAFKKLMSEGRFILLLDGFDELNESIRDVLQADIVEIARSYPDLGMIVSSRDSDRFAGWSLFDIYHSLPFEREQVAELLDRIEFEPAVKRKFSKEIVDAKFDDYKDFLRTPLLILMMLLTFRQFATISPKRHIFYRHAFTTLYSEHDASKEAFSRERKSGLDEDEYAKIFALFCLYSYLDGAIGFTRDRLYGYIDRAVRRTGIEVDTKKFVEEATESVNLLLSEGEYYTFTHRSFQEYFAAVGIVDNFKDKIVDVFDRLPNVETDAVIPLCYEINPALVEDGYVFPQLTTFEDDLTKLATRSDDILARLMEFEAAWIIDLKVTGRASIYNSFFSAHHLYKIVSILARIYPAEVERFSPQVGETLALAAKIRQISKVILKVYKRLRPSELVFFDFAKGDGWHKSISTGQIEALPGAVSYLPISDPVLLREWGRHLSDLERVFSSALSLLPSIRLRHERRQDDDSDLF